MHCRYYYYIDTRGKEGEREGGREGGRTMLIAAMRVYIVGMLIALFTSG